MKPIIVHHLSNHLLKCAALILSALCWLHINYGHTVCCTIEVPLLFEHTDAERMLHAPETIPLQLSGTRSALYAIDAHESAICIDARELHVGNQVLTISRDKIFLPQSVSMLNYIPCTIVVS